MRVCFLFFSLLFGIGTTSHDIYGQILWDTLAPLPVTGGDLFQPGVAGAFSGIDGQVMMVAGGANFRGGYPWAGGVKEYQDEIFLFDFTIGKKGAWLDTVFKMSKPMAYGATVSTRNGLICIGGRNDTSIFKSVFRLSYQRNNAGIIMEDLPPLPMPLTGLAATSIGNVIYVAGGENESGTTRSFYRIDLSMQDAKWEILPGWPGKAVTNSVLVAQQNGSHSKVYLFGGKLSEPGRAAAFTNEVFEYDPMEYKWIKKRGITNAKQEAVPLSAGVGLKTGKKSVLLFGGNSAQVYKNISEYNYSLSQSKTTEEERYWREKLNQAFAQHQGFDRTIYVYDTHWDTWSEGGTLPYPTPATIGAFSIENKIILPSGEVRPGVRTPRVIIGTLNPNQY